jgi:serpin B
MTGKPDFFISAVVHQADIEVDEEGTVAAAATAVEEFQATAVMPPPPAVTFTVDHPFLYLIRDNASGSILFLGRMLDPR